MGVRDRGTRGVAGMACAIPSEPPKLVAGIEKAALLAVLRLMPRANGLSHPTASVLRQVDFTPAERDFANVFMLATPGRRSWLFLCFDS